MIRLEKPSVASASSCALETLEAVGATSSSWCYSDYNGMAFCDVDEAEMDDYSCNCVWTSETHGYCVDRCHELGEER